MKLFVIAQVIALVYSVIAQEKNEESSKIVPQNEDKLKPFRGIEDSAQLTGVWFEVASIGHPNPESCNCLRIEVKKSDAADSFTVKSTCLTQQDDVRSGTMQLTEMNTKLLMKIKNEIKEVLVVGFDEKYHDWIAVSTQKSKSIHFFFRSLSKELNFNFALIKQVKAFVQSNQLGRLVFSKCRSSASIPGQSSRILQMIDQDLCDPNIESNCSRKGKNIQPQKFDVSLLPKQVCAEKFDFSTSSSLPTCSVTSNKYKRVI